MQGSQKTKDFYEDQGWQECNGKLLDTALFGYLEDGPIRQALHRERTARIRRAIGSGVELIEAGCGGTPAVELLDLCVHYTGVDFAASGLQHAEKHLSSTPHRLAVADITALPFADGEFSAVYSAHVLYHIPTPDEQAMALRELMRVLRPGGKAVLVVANPRPLISPVRMVKRLIADLPWVGHMLNKYRKPLIPYKPMPIGWMLRQLRPFGVVKVSCHALSSVQFNRLVSEFSVLGRLAWRTTAWLERRNWPWAGNYVQYEVHRIEPGNAH